MNAKTNQLHRENSQILEKSDRSLALDGLRGIACLLVCFFHTGANIGIMPFLIWGFTGVHLFFVLSGYLISRPFLKALIEGGNLPSMSRFYLRRFLRIYPAYFVSLLVFLALRQVTHTNVPDAFNIVTHVALIFNYFDSHYFFAINPVFWSLAIEAQFYILLPVFAWAIYKVVAKQRQLASILLIALFVAVGLASRCTELLYHQAFQLGEDVPYFKTIFSFLDLFGFGMIVAYLEVNPVWKKFARPTHLLSLGAALFLLANYWCSMDSPGIWLQPKSLIFGLSFPPLICLGIALILLGILNLGRLPSFPVPQLAFVGTTSYSIYLYHTGVQYFIFKLLLLNDRIKNYNVRAISSAFITLPFILCLGFFMFKAVEEPFLRKIALSKR